MTRTTKLILTALASTLVPAFAQNPVFPNLNLGRETRGSAILSALGGRMPEVAKFYGLSEQEFGALCLRDVDLRANRNGRLFYVCEGITAEAPTAQNGGTQALLSYPASQTFTLHSKPGLTRVIYLDFDGHTTTDTAWNNGVTFTTPAYNTDSSATSFGTAELANIQEIWKRVSEDFAPWDVDVTTEQPAAGALAKSGTTDTAYGIRVVIGGDGKWYGSAGGVAYVGSFSWSTDTPAFVFPDMLGYGWPKYVAEAISHESGHTLGLTHDGTTTGQAYYAGNNGWAPIMGDSYEATVSQFSRGEYTGANNLQDDLAVIDTHVPRSPDLSGNAISTAVPLGGSSIAVTGIIESRTDADLFRVDAGNGPLSVNATPASPDANLDIVLSLYDSLGTLVTSANPAGTSATLSRTLSAGTYYIAVEGAGTSSTGATGYTDYASIGQYTLSGSLVSSAGSPPVAVISPAGATVLAGGTVSFSSAGSYDPDGSALTYNWDFGDGTSSTEANPAHTYSVAGTYAASLVVFDATGFSGSASTFISVKSASQVIYVSGISMTVTTSKRGKQAKAVVTVRDAAGALKSGVTVTGAWSGLTTGTSNVVTASNGTATFTSAASTKTGTFSFKVTNLALSGATYDAQRNATTTGGITNTGLLTQ